jgi:hypothetical protein
MFAGRKRNRKWQRNVKKKSLKNKIIHIIHNPFEFRYLWLALRSIYSNQHVQQKHTRIAKMSHKSRIRVKAYVHSSKNSQISGNTSPSMNARDRLLDLSLSLVEPIVKQHDAGINYCASYPLFCDYLQRTLSTLFVIHHFSQEQTA